jgi:hypothetical protein
MKQKTLELSRDCKLLRVTVCCPHGESVDFEFPTPSKNTDAFDAERRRALAMILRNNKKTWKRIEQGHSVFGRCMQCMRSHGMG